MRFRTTVHFLLLALALGTGSCSRCGGGGASATAGTAALLPAYSVGVAAIKSLAELSGDLGVAGLVAAGGPDAQRGWAAAMGLVGFDLANPATMSAAGLDPAAPIGFAVTRIAGEQTTPLVVLQTTDPAAATAFLMQRAPLAGISMGGPMQMGTHTVYTGSGQASIAATFFDKTLVIAFGAPNAQPVGAIQELMGVEGGQVPKLADDEAYKAATGRIGAADIVGYLNAPSLLQGLAAMPLPEEQRRALNELGRMRALCIAMDVDGGVFSIRSYASTTPGAFPAQVFSDDASDVPVLDRIGGAPLFSVRATIALPAIWAQMAPQLPSLAELRQQMMQESGLNLDTDIVGMLTGTFSVTGFRVGTQPNANDIVVTAGITDPAKLQRVIQVVASRMPPQAVPVGGTMVYTWDIETVRVSVAQIGNQVVLGWGRDAMGIARIMMGQEGPSFRTQIADPGVAERYGRGMNGAFFVNLQPIAQQLGAGDPSAAQWMPVTGTVQSLGGFSEPAEGGTYGQIDLRLAPGQTIAGWLGAIVRIAATPSPVPPPMAPPPAFPTP